MDIVLVGYGKMGRAVYDMAQKRNHKIINKFNTKNISNISNANNSANINNNTIGIDFTNPQAFRHNYRLLADYCQAVIVGTTGWEDIKQDVFNCFTQKNKTLIYANNFSLGTNIFFKIVTLTTKLIAGFEDYDPYILEMHHREKKDQPSGTAKTLATILKHNLHKEVHPVALRSGWIKGIHEVGYESQLDKITLRNEAYSRDGFAMGAILAAEWSENLRGIHNFKDILNTKFKEFLT